MPGDTPPNTSPRWDDLYEIACAQEGHFSNAQAAAAGYSPQLLTKYLKSGRVVRSRRGVYRLVHFPSGDHEDLVVLWLWSGQVGGYLGTRQRLLCMGSQTRCRRRFL